MGLQKAQSVSRSAERKWHIVYDKRAIHPDFERLAVLREAPGQQADARQAVADAVAGQQIMRRLGSAVAVKVCTRYFRSKRERSYCMVSP
jgi:hypothetical protein